MQTMAKTLAVCLGSLVTLLAGDALAQNPPPPFEIPYRGVLEQDGVLVDGISVDMQFDIYDAATGGTPIWTETHIGVPVAGGKFSVMLGSTPSPIDIAVLQQNPELYIGVTVQGVELAGRQRLLAVPYARRSEDGVPSGALMFFVTPTCPTGWSEYGPVQGRAIVGTPAAGTNLAEMGSPLANEVAPTHTHPIDVMTAIGTLVAPGVRRELTSDTDDLNGPPVGGDGDDLVQGQAAFASRFGGFTSTAALRGYDHTHTTTGDTAENETSDPAHLPYIQVRACVKD
jgi:hypothetical protein